MSGYDVTCRELIEFLADYLSGALPARQREDFEDHLRLCPPCVAYLKSYQDTMRLGKSALKPSDERAPADVPEELITAILSARSKRKD